MQEKEIWRDIIGYEGLYMVSSFGRVKSLDRYVNHYPSGKMIQKGDVIKAQINKRGYESLKLSRGGKSIRFLVHRLVLIAFIPNPENKEQVNHIDCNKRNNYLENLEWSTQSENMRHSFDNNLHNKAGDNHPSHKLSGEQVIEIRKNNTPRTKRLIDIAEEYNVSFYCISDLLRGKTWSHLL